MIDLHCDTIMKLIDYPSNGDLYRNTWKIDIEKLQKAHSKILQDFALFINLGSQMTLMVVMKRCVIYVHHKLIWRAHSACALLSRCRVCI